jgi:hypothetical protein
VKRSIAGTEKLLEAAEGEEEARGFDMVGVLLESLRLITCCN